MKLNRAELRKILYDFNSISNRLLQADFRDHTKVVSRFVAFVKATPIIYDYVLDCGTSDQNMDNEFKEIRNSYGRVVFDLGFSDSEEVRNVFAILEYVAENNINVAYEIAAGYSSSTKYQDRTKAFNDRVVMVLIRHLESYLTKVGIDMGIDEKVSYNITVTNGQVNIASDNSTINATNNVGSDVEKIASLINDVRVAATGISDEDAETLSDNLEVIEEQVKAERPKKGFIRTALAGLKTIKGTVEFASAVAALTEFLMTALN